MAEEQVYTVKVNKHGDIRWYNADGKYHRLDGPACEWSDGTKVWYQNGKLHRLDGPAYEWADGSKSWCQNGKLHRLDGPAIENSSGHKEWWIENRSLTEAEFNKRTKPDPCDGQYITLENGRKYQLTAVKGDE